MQNINSSDYGTYSAWTVPTPDDQLTVRWGSAIAMNVAKITKAFAISTLAGGTLSVSMQAANFSNFPPPIIQVYESHFGEYWTSYNWLGNGNNLGAIVGEDQKFCVKQAYGGSVLWIIPSIGTRVFIAFGG